MHLVPTCVFTYKWEKFWSGWVINVISFWIYFSLITILFCRRVAAKWAGYAVDWVEEHDSGHAGFIYAGAVNAILRHDARGRALADPA